MMASLASDCLKLSSGLVPIKLDFFCFFAPKVSIFRTLKILTLLVHAGYFGGFYNLPDSDRDYRIFNVRM